MRGSGFSDSYAFPGGAHLDGYAPTLLITAERDRLTSSGEAFRDELRDASTVVDYWMVPGTLHGFLNEPEDPAALRVIDRMAEYARSSVRV